MKKLLFILFFTYSLSNLFAQNDIKIEPVGINIKSLKESTPQPPAINTSNIIGDFEKIDTTNRSKDVMWVNLKRWISSSFKNYKYVVDMEDKDAGVLIVKWTSVFYPQSSRFLKCTINSSFQIDIREKKYRVKIHDGYVNVAPHVEDARNLSTASLKEAKSDLTTITNISTSYFNSLLNWNIDEHYSYAIKSSDDKAKSILNDILNNYTSVCSGLYESLSKEIIVKDDF